MALESAQAVPESDGFMGAALWPDLDWAEVRARLEASPEKLASLAEMEATGLALQLYRRNFGQLPLQFEPGDSATALGLTGEETYDIATAGLTPRAVITVRVRPAAGEPSASDRPRS